MGPPSRSTSSTDYLPLLGQQVLYYESKIQDWFSRQCKPVWPYIDLVREALEVETVEEFQPVYPAGASWIPKAAGPGPGPGSQPPERSTFSQTTQQVQSVVERAKSKPKFQQKNYLTWPLRFRPSLCYDSDLEGNFLSFE